MTQPPHPLVCSQVECLYALEDYEGLAALVSDPEQQLAEGRSGPSPKVDF